jgi:hypothetical protein
MRGTQPLRQAARVVFLKWLYDSGVKGTKLPKATAAPSAARSG